MGLTAATYLGDTTVAALVALCERLSRVLDTEVRFDPEAPRSSTDARVGAARHDLVWMCGSLAVTMQAEDQLAHQIVAAPVFAGENGPVYRSVVIAHPEGPRTLTEALDTATLGVNEQESWSGHHALRRHAATRHPGRWFRAEAVTGSHAASIHAVADDPGLVAAIDSSVWHSASAPLRAIERTGDWPAPPFLVRRSLRPDSRRALVGALVDPSNRPPDLVGIVPIGGSDYAAMRV